MGEEGKPVEMKVDIDVPSFDPSKKKKKKKKVVVHDPKEEDLAIVHGQDNDHEVATGQGTTTTLNDDDRDYTYEELLGRVSNMMDENENNNPNMVASSGGRRVAKLTLRPPEVLREGTKKTVLVNLMDFCKRMHREPEHIMSFLLVELGATGSLDGQQRLVVKGRFDPSKFEGILRRYCNEYVTCNACRSSNTILSKEENRLLFVRCEQCGSARTVAPINNKGVFLAQVQHRKNSRPRGS